jgi:hypothetical protein
LKASFFFLLFIFYNADLLAQSESRPDDDLSIVYKQIRNISPSVTIYYIDKPGEKFFENIIRDIDHSTVKSISKIYPNSINLTKVERRYLVSQFKKSASAILRDNLFPDSKRIPLDSVENRQHEILAKIKKLHDSINDKDSLIAFTNKYKYCKAIFTFTMPIYIRSNSIFLQYFSWYDGGGAESLYFCRKENNEWKKWIIVSAGDW